MLEFGMAVALIISLFAGREAIKKPLVVVMDGDKVVQEVYAKAPILVRREGDRLEVRQMRTRELKRARLGAKN